MKRQSCTLTAFGLLLAASQSFAAPGPTTSLPLKRARFYDSGVGYFERTGALDASHGARLPVPAGHLDDALKTMVVLSADGETSVQGFQFRSSASRPLALALAGLSPSSDDLLGFATLLRSLKGASAEVRTAAGRVRGRVIEVVEPDPERNPSCAAPPPASDAAGSNAVAVAAWAARCAEENDTSILILTDASEIRRIRASDVTAVEPLDPAFRSRLSAALDTLSSRGAQTTRELDLRAIRGKSVTLGYVAEAPIWRSTYRLVLGPDGQASTIQGWALLHNDTDEDWHGVRVELVNGQPDSFLFPLAAPRYAHRELVTPEQDLSTVPQLLDTTVDNMWTGHGRLGRSHRARPPQVRMGATSVGGGGGGIGEGMLGLGAIRADGAAPSDLLAVGNLAGVAEAEGVEAGALFRYELASPMDLQAHGSALVPFVQRSVSATRIATFSEPGATARSAVHLRNDTPQTLPAGPISIFADGGFAGESAILRTQPTESRIIRFGYDLDVELTEQSTAHQDAPRLLVASGSSITEHFVRTHDIHYLLVNRAGSERTAYLRLGFVRNSEIQGTEGTAFDPETDQAHAVFRIGARERADRHVVVREGLSRTHEFSELPLPRLEQLADVTSLPEAQRRILRAAVERLRSAQRIDRGARQLASERRALEDKATRLREILNALEGQAVASAEEVGEQLLEAEQGIDDLAEKIGSARAAAKAERKRAGAELRKLKGS